MSIDICGESQTTVCELSNRLVHVDGDSRAQAPPALVTAVEPQKPACTSHVTLLKISKVHSCPYAIASCLAGQDSQTSRLHHPGLSYPNISLSPQVSEQDEHEHVRQLPVLIRGELANRFMGRELTACSGGY
eukprot:scaffold50035_cov22-Tisochrysis_lutea.AAC.4